MGDSTPKILYQTWKTKEIPKLFRGNVEKWLAFTPGWQHTLLDDKDLRDMVATQFPNYLEAYDSFTKPIERVDFARYVMMYLGGVYADLDTYPIKPIDSFVNMNKIVLGREPVEHARDIYQGRTVVLCNAFMISPPKQKFWIDLMDYIVQNYEPNYNPVDNTGPMAMTRFYETHPQAFADILITDPCTFFPLTGKRELTQGCDMEKDTYVVHLWDNTWVVPWWQDPRWFNKRYWSWAIIMVLFVVCLYLYAKRKT
jgi:hypothetical protein